MINPYNRIDYIMVVRIFSVLKPYFVFEKRHL